MSTYQPVIGLEIHAQLNTKSKLFSGSSTQFGGKANEYASLIDLAFPGTLPVLNIEAVKKAIRFALGIGAVINKRSLFERKNYFYPDLPKGYQTSQLQTPIVGQGELVITLKDGSQKAVAINRAHLEEDAGKSLHEDFHGQTGIDLNRAGIPLLEIVTEPVLYSAEEAVCYMKTLHQLVKHLNICDGNMQEGSFRCDVNISLKKEGEEKLGTRTEIKNLNSFRFVEKAIQVEINRQTKLLNNGEAVVQETRLYCPDSNETRTMRSKEEAHDYRYFPCPDLLPVIVSEEMIETIKKTMPKSVEELLCYLQEELSLGSEDAEFFAKNTAFYDYLEALRLLDNSIPIKLMVNWLRGSIAQKLNEQAQSLTECPLQAERLISLLQAVNTNVISSKMAKSVFESLWESNKTADEIIKEQGLKQVDDTSLLKDIINKLITNNPKQAEDLKAGKEKLMGFFVGQVMKETKGQANPKQVNDLLKEQLDL